MLRQQEESGSQQKVAKDCPQCKVALAVPRHSLVDESQLCEIYPRFSCGNSSEQ